MRNIFLILSLFIFSCDEDDNYGEDIIGKWHLTEYAPLYFETIPDRVLFGIVSDSWEFEKYGNIRFEVGSTYMPDGTGEIGNGDWTAPNENTITLEFTNYWTSDNLADSISVDGSLISYNDCENFNGTYSYIISDTIMTLTSSNATIKFLKP